MISLEQIAGSALAHRSTTLATYDVAQLLIENDVPGDFVECGVYAGAQVAAMALALMPHTEHGRRIHLFDTFSGIPAAGEHDIEFRQAGHKAGLSACSLAQVKANMQRWGIDPALLVYHPGLFRDTIPTCGIEQIAFLRLDGDLYESTRDALQLLPLVSPGGWVCADDFHLSGCRKAIYEVCNPGPVYWQVAR